MMRKKFRIKLMLQTASHKRKVASFLLLIFLVQTFAPTTAFALTGGPSQPEVQSFEPIGTSEMVDLFSGDFNYNIPLIDMDGYPINIGYHSGITMDQEASWVGLGWNINPGVINRGMRGIPDDFKGEEITKDLNTKPNRTFGINAGFESELLGFQSLGTSFSIGAKYNNYRGIGLEQSISAPMSSGANNYGSYTAGLGITSSSDEGLSVQPQIALDKRNKEQEDQSGATVKSTGLKIGVAFNSRAGLTGLTIDPYSKKTEMGKNSEGKDEAKKSETTDIPFGSSSFSLGMPTFTPQVTMPMVNFSLNGSFEFGGELFGVAGQATISGYMSTQRLFKKTVTNPAYGYLYSELGQYNEDAILDFNRERDGQLTLNTPALPLTNFTYDMLSVSGQGIAGNYRPFRNEMAYVFDPLGYSFSTGGSIGLEAGAGNAVHLGSNPSVTYSGTRSEAWSTRNRAIDKLRFKNQVKGAINEKVNFSEANEKVIDANNDFFEAYGSYKAQRFILNKRVPFNHGLEDKLTDDTDWRTIPTTNFKTKRNKRSQTISYLTKKEVLDGLGLNNFYDNDTYTGAKDYHLNEITTYSTDGSRYVYGIAAYNHFQDEVTFAVGDGLYNETNGIAPSANGLVTYLDSDASKENNRGIDNYYSSTHTPAYAHSYLLTSVLSSDYIDNDNVKGPSVGDLGNYTKFNYTKAISDFNWRTPVGNHFASYSEGLKTDKTDDKASYVHGEKDIWYLTKLESKNYVAVFHLSNRNDGLGVQNKYGDIETSENKKLKKLDKISLYTTAEFYTDIAGQIPRSNPLPIKEVNFEYDYSLSSNVPNSTAGGKLTLKRIYFTYQNSKKARLSPYTFNYSNINPAYDMKMYDRWGGYKSGTASLDVFDDISNAEFPYSEQNQTSANNNCRAWTLNDIKLPSGGKIQVEFESDDYAYVQHKRAMQMFKIVGTFDEGVDPATKIESMPNSIPLGDCSSINASKNKILILEVENNTANVAEYFKGIKDVYFRCLTRMSVDESSNNYDYVSGYAELDDNYAPTSFSVGGKKYLSMRLKPVKMNDNAPNIGTASSCISTGEVYNPIIKAATQFGRLNLSRYVWGELNLNNQGFGSQVINAIINSSPLKNIKDAILGPNLALYVKGVGKSIVSGKSWIRLNDSDYKKLGGGSRVKTITLTDEWVSMLGITDSNNNYDYLNGTYGQQYDYTIDGQMSSGVASYEPQLGGDENPWKEPVHFGEKKFLAPDDRFYQEKPYGESFFPSPSVGYSKITVKNLERQDVTKHATGKVVHEFYTAKDFPTLVEYTKLEIDRDKFNPFGLGSLFKLKSKDHLAASQGFKIETNDMHGKQKSQKVYQEGKDEPITSVEYFYKSTPYSFESSTNSTEIAGNTFKLENDCNIINSNGTVGTARLGVYYDMIADMRQSRSETTNTAIPINGDGFFAAILPIYIAMILPGFGKEVVQVRTASTTKVIQRFGILEKTVAKDLGSVVSTNNLAYDSETGEVLLTQTTTNFNDNIYNLSYPAHWYYDGMGLAYKNIGYEKDMTITNGIAIVTNAPIYYTPGDELAVYFGNNPPLKAWVTNVSSNSITVQTKTGINVTGSGTASTKIIRSGRKNLNSVKIASITTLSNPLNSFSNNVFENVLQASSIEFTDSWKTNCECFSGGLISSNPYVLGTKGNWKPKRSWLHLSPRKQTYENQNTNIRKDGVFTSYTPFYTFGSGKWNIDERNWTYTSEVTEFSPYGQELENKDALGRYSAANFGYRQTLATAVAANSQYKELGFDNFEDINFSTCADGHLKFTTDINQLAFGISHSGNYSLIVNNNNPIILHKYISNCAASNCNIEITKTESSSNQTSDYVISNGAAPYSIDWDIVSGDVQINLLANGNGIQAVGNNYTITITTTDAVGCKTIKTFHQP